MALKAKAPPAPPDPTKLKRESAGRYATGDGRFTVEQSSNGWMVVDAEQTNELGLPLVRGPFGTLEEARDALGEARTGPAPTSDLAERAAKLPRTRADGPPAKAPKRSRSAAGRRGRAARAAAAGHEEPEVELPIELREYRSGDGDPLRALWEAAGFASLGDDDKALRVFAQRNPATFLVATRGDEVVGSAMGGWDGRRGWIYHVAVAEPVRRGGLGTRLVREVEERLAALGCPKVNAIVCDANDDGPEFWVSLGYSRHDAHQYGRELGSGAR